MTSVLARTARELGDGSIFRFENGSTGFRLSSFYGNPIVRPGDLGLTWRDEGREKTGAVFNGGAEFFEGKVILMPRCHADYHEGSFVDEKTGLERICLENYVSEIWPLVSDDGIHFSRLHDLVIRGDGTEHQEFTYGIEDVRIVRQGARHLLVGCGKVKPAFKGTNADRIAVYSTEGFNSIVYHGIVDCFDSRNGVPFPEMVNGRFPMLLRFHPNIHLDYLEAGVEQLLNPARHRSEWEKLHKQRGESLLLATGKYLHEMEKIGPGPQVIKTDRGWLLIYHAVGELDEEICREYGLEGRIDRGYSICAALLSLDDPRKVLCRTPRPIYIPSEPYELRGSEHLPVDVPAVVFPVGAFVLEDKLMVYAGAGDKYIVLLSCKLPELVDFLWDYCKYAG
jgi:predicted GH43/DUF377 family glycosyl hydrolase